MKLTTSKITYTGKKGFEPYSDANRFYTNNFGNPRTKETNEYINQSTTHKAFKGHKIDTPNSNKFEEMTPKEAPKMNKKSTYTKDFKSPKFD